jgi:hypothetical protein
VKTTRYFQSLSKKADRVIIKTEWIQQVIDTPESEMTQMDGRIRIWGKIPEAGNRYLRVILLHDRETVHKAFFVRRFKP